MTFPDRFAPAALLALLAGCGYVGEPLPPSLEIPARVTDLTAIERGEKIAVEFTIPSLTTDGVVIEKIKAVDLRAGLSPGESFDTERWAAQAMPVPVEAARPGPVHVETPARVWVGREVIIGVRVAGRKGRFSDWSNLVALRVVEPLETPVALKAEAVAEGVRLGWSVPGEHPGLSFRIYRRAEKQTDPELLGRADRPEYVDTSAEFGGTYEYAVQTELASRESKVVSEISGPVVIKPQDRFPPAVPAGLTAAPGVGSIELVWERNTEADLRGYRIYRAVNGGRFEPVGGLLDTPSFGDHDVASGKRYRYAVSSVDVSGNESALSPPVEVVAP